jgi:hypothetical protein
MLNFWVNNQFSRVKKGASPRGSASILFVGDGGGRWVAEGIAAPLFLYLGEP